MLIYIILNIDKREVLDISYSRFFASALKLLYRICYKNVIIIPIDRFKLGNAVCNSLILIDEISLEFGERDAGRKAAEEFLMSRRVNKSTEGDENE